MSTSQLTTIACWLVHNGTSWKLRWFDHTTSEQHVQGDELVNSLLNR